jgi:hypothetical protein
LRRYASHAEIKNNIMEELINLPPKWKVKEIRKDKRYDYLNEKGEIEIQSKSDNNSARKYCWGVYNKIVGK